MTTEVSTRPRAGREASAKGHDVLAGGAIEVGSEPVELQARSASERGESRLGAYEPMPTQRGELADRDSIPGHDEGLTLVKLAHYLAAVIAKLTLSDLFGHTPTVALVLRIPMRRSDTQEGAAPDGGSSVGVSSALAEAVYRGHEMEVGDFSPICSSIATDALHPGKVAAVKSGRLRPSRAPIGTRQPY